MIDKKKLINISNQNKKNLDKSSKIDYKSKEGLINMKMSNKLVVKLNTENQNLSKRNYFNKSLRNNSEDD